MSDDEETLFESEQEMSVSAVARRLREVVQGLETGALQVGGHAVTLASTVKFEEEYSAETTDEGITYELEFELKWSSAPSDGHATHAGKFELFKDSGGKFRFRLKAANGEIIVTSQAYETKASAQSGIKSVRTNSTGRIDDQT